MQKLSPGQLADWITITVRWVFLMGVSLWIALGYEFTWPVILLLAFGGVGNIFFTIIAAIEFKLPAYREISLIGDMLIAYLLFFLTWPVISDLAWVGLLPLMTASMYYRWPGAVALVFLNLLVQGGIAWRATDSQGTIPVDILLLIGLLFIFYLLVGLGTAFGSRRLGGGGGRRRKARSDQGDATGQLERERRRTIYDLVTKLSASLNYQRTLENALNLSLDTLAEAEAPVEDLVGAVMLFSENGASLEVMTSRLLLPADKNLTLPGTSGLIGYAIDEGQATLSKDISGDPELSRFASLRSYHSAYCIPLRSGLDAYGIMFFAHPQAEFFTPDRCEVLDIIGKQFVIAIQNARLYQDLEQEKERMMEIQEDSRKQLARELHDGPTQSVAAIAMRVNFARRLMERDANAAAEELFKIEELARRTTKEIRLMLFTLRPLVLESQGLLAALESLAEKMKDTFGKEVIVQADPRVINEMETAKQAVVFYIAEEAANNARKHAQSDHIWIRLRMTRKGLSLLEIEDDGVGFDLKKVDTAYEDRGSLGMVNMRERAELVNGILHIDSASGRGTKVQVAIPLTNEAAELLRRGA